MSIRPKGGAYAMILDLSPIFFPEVSLVNKASLALQAKDRQLGSWL